MLHGALQRGEKGPAWQQRGEKGPAWQTWRDYASAADSRGHGSRLALLTCKRLRGFRAHGPARRVALVDRGRRRPERRAARRRQWARPGCPACLRVDGHDPPQNAPATPASPATSGPSTAGGDGDADSDDGSAATSGSATQAAGDGDADSDDGPAATSGSSTQAVGDGDADPDDPPAPSQAPAVGTTITGSMSWFGGPDDPLAGGPSRERAGLPQ